MSVTQEPITDDVPAIITTRVIEVSKGTLFKAYSDPEILAQWWGPKGFTNTFHEFDFNPDGQWNFIMRGPDGKDYKNKIVFREIVPLEKIVFDHASGPYYKGTVTFTDTDQPNCTQLSYAMILESPKVYNNLKDFIAGANEENFDRLEETLSKLTKK
ncbi:SRPBCC domain-containing protein [Emticicia sp. C21]|uniref:SRPBCC domain-containing protein n=1 Tax=Emticicia sp. C21 TaxID=2302915 RepID=UPI000E3419EC|nr:SRPBCC domain-containing protein [Emticicia sp. C21]RFS14214.1 polyketide cyclase [Emticicia sp. C21]